ncbi:MAG: hypothetical protein ABI340_09175 [Nitrososphaera sp.]|jgi:uncharacterized membrane protein
MQRGFMLMIIGIAIQVVNWVLSSSQTVKGFGGYLTIIGWVIFFAGLGIRQLDKKKLQSNQAKKK